MEARGVGRTPLLAQEHAQAANRPLCKGVQPQREEPGIRLARPAKTRRSRRALPATPLPRPGGSGRGRGGRDGLEVRAQDLAEGRVFRHALVDPDLLGAPADAGRRAHLPPRGGSGVGQSRRRRQEEPPLHAPREPVRAALHARRVLPAALHRRLHEAEFHPGPLAARLEFLEVGGQALPPRRGGGLRGRPGGLARPPRVLEEAVVRPEVGQAVLCPPDPPRVCWWALARAARRLLVGTHAGDAARSGPAPGAAVLGYPLPARPAQRPRPAPRRPRRGPGGGGVRPHRAPPGRPGRSPALALDAARGGAGRGGGECRRGGCGLGGGGKFAAGWRPAGGPLGGAPAQYDYRGGCGRYSRPRLNSRHPPRPPAVRVGLRRGGAQKESGAGEARVLPLSTLLPPLLPPTHLHRAAARASSHPPAWNP